MYVKQEINGIIVYDKLPKVYKNYEDFSKESIELIKLEGFIPLIEQNLLTGEKFGKIVIDYENNQAFYEILNIEEENLKEIKKTKIKEENENVSIIWVGNTPDGLKTFSIGIDNSGKLISKEIKQL